MTYILGYCWFFLRFLRCQSYYINICCWLFKARNWFPKSMDDVHLYKTWRDVPRLPPQQRGHRSWWRLLVLEFFTPNGGLIVVVRWLEMQQLGQKRQEVLQVDNHASVVMHIGVSKNRCTPKWMVYNGKPDEQMDDLGGYPYFWIHPYWCFIGLDSAYVGIFRWVGPAFQRSRPQMVGGAMIPVFCGWINLNNH